jgi:hypothetical protein
VISGYISGELEMLLKFSSVQEVLLNGMFVAGLAPG